MFYGMYKIVYLIYFYNQRCFCVFSLYDFFMMLYLLTVMGWAAFTEGKYHVYVLITFSLLRLAYIFYLTKKTNAVQILSCLSHRFFHKEN